MIKYCPKCEEYTLKNKCEKHNIKTISKKPAKFKIAEDYSKHRLKIKGLI